jgi:hypothetical protein
MTEPTNFVSIHIEARRARDQAISEALASSWQVLRAHFADAQKRPLPRMG